MSVSARVTIRRGMDDDIPAILALLTEMLGWADDSRHRALYQWKHVDNPFGASPFWVACDEERIVGVRLLMRWRFRRGSDSVAAVRAVDTATHRDYQGQGIFSALTRTALDELRDEGVHLVFNTPNDSSRPGYLKMGWQVIGRLPLALRPTSPLALPRMARARVPAELWSAPTHAGVSAAEILHGDALAGLAVAAGPASTGLATEVSPAYLRWRFGLPDLGYRAVVLRDDPARGIAFFRVRRRGPAREAALGGMLLADDDARERAALVRTVARAVDADYVAALGRRPRGFVPVPRLGPILTARPIADSSTVPPLAGWDLGLGDVELF